MKIIRVENRIDGKGPFNSYTHMLSIGDYCNNDLYTYPNIEMDFEYKLYCDYNNGKLRSGCLNACSFFHWFSESIEYVLTHFDVYEIEVKHYYIGKSSLQILFKPEDEISRRKLNFTYGRENSRSVRKHRNRLQSFISSVK